MSIGHAYTVCLGFFQLSTRNITLKLRFLIFYQALNIILEIGADR